MIFGTSSDYPDFASTLMGGTNQNPFIGQALQQMQNMTGGSSPLMGIHQMKGMSAGLPSASDLIYGYMNRHDWSAPPPETEEEKAARLEREWLRGPEYPEDRRSWPFPGQPNPEAVADTYARPVLWLAAALSAYPLIYLVVVALRNLAWGLQ